MDKRYEWDGVGKCPALRHAEMHQPRRYEGVCGEGDKISILALRNFWTTPIVNADFFNRIAGRYWLEFCF